MTLDIIVGPMFAGKTTKLMELLDEAQREGKNIIAFKHDIDDRFSSTQIGTHDQKFINAISCSKLLSCYSVAINYDCIGIDEGQFFPDIVEFCKSLIALGKRVIVSGLDGTFERKPFGKLLYLLPFATSFLRLNSLCPITGKSAPFSQRLIQSNEKVVIGGSESYSPISRSVLFPGSGKLELFIINNQKKKLSKEKNNYYREKETTPSKYVIDFQNEKGFASKCDLHVQNGSNIKVIANINSNSLLPDELRILIPLCDEVSYIVQ